MKFTDSEIIKEATEAVEKGLDAGYAVGQLLNIINSQKVEIKFLRSSKDLNKAEFNEIKVKLKLKDAEIERLKAENEIKSQKRANIFEIVDAYERGRTKGIKEFTKGFEKRCIAGGIYPAFVKRSLERVKKEMTGE